MSRIVRTTWCGVVVVLLGVLVCVPAAQAEKRLLRLRMDGEVLESPNDAAGLMALFGETQTRTLHDWTTMIRQAARDSDINGLALIVEQPLVNLAQVEELTGALADFRARHKPVYCYLDYGTNLSYALAAAADHITMAENSSLETVGLYGEMMFYKGLLDKIGVEADMMHCGAYKSFIEPYTRTEPSPEAAENIEWLFDSLYARWIQLIADGRGKSPDEVKALIDEAPLSAARALEAGLVDEVSSFSAFRERMHAEFGADVEVVDELQDEDALDIDLENPFAVFALLSQMMEGATEPETPGIGLIYIEGMIMVGRSDDSPFGGAMAGSTTLRALFEQARKDERIQAVVVRVDSPGGSALASDIIWEAAKRCAAEKPLIVSMGRVAASGGYYVSVPADTIFADAATVTASIGVGGGKIVWRELMEDKLGITTTEIKRGKHAGMMSLNSKWDESERAWLRGYMEETYTQFKSRITDSRGERLKKDIAELAEGRVFTGAQALELGLVDKLGGLSDALDFAAQKAGLGRDCELYILPKPSELAAFMSFMEKLVGDEGQDDFEIGMSARLRDHGLLRAALPVLRELAPRRCGEVIRGLQNLLILEKEHVGCFLPFVPDVH